MFFTFGETSASERKLSLGMRRFLAMDGQVELPPSPAPSLPPGRRASQAMDGQVEPPPNPAPGLTPGRRASQADLCGLIQDN